MKVTIEHGGKKIDVELTAEQVKELGLQEKKKTGWERANSDKAYAHIDGCMQLTQEMDYDTMGDNTRYQQGNYFTDSNLAVKMLKRVRLMLKMQRWADEHNGPLDWNDSCTCKHFIFYNVQLNKFEVSVNTIAMRPGTVYFSSNEIAEAAIKEFGDDLIDCYIESEVTR